MTQYWLIKSEPETYSIEDMERDKVECWEGIRNYQARNFMRDSMKKGDMALFYHSSCAVPGAVGVVKVDRESYPDYTCWDPDSPYFDEKSSEESPRWFMVDFAFVERFADTVSLKAMKAKKELEDMPLFKRGTRLSIQPLTEKQFKVICEMSKS